MRELSPNPYEGDAPFRLLVENVRDYAIFMLDPTGRIISWNLGAERLKGYKASEAIGQHFSIFYGEKDKQDRKPQRELEQAALTGRVEDEGWRLRKDGTRFWANVVITALRTPDGSLYGYGKVTRDMTERREAQENLRTAYEDMEQRVILRTRELQDANDQLEAFAYSISHDLRAPLRAMHSLAEALQEDYAESLDEEGREYTQRIVSSAQRMDGMIQDLLAYSRLSRADLVLADVDLDSVIDDALFSLQVDIRDTNAEVVVERPLGHVDGDRGTLIHVFSNLIGNAMKFRSPDKRPELRVNSEERSGQLRISFEDNGIGIAPQHQQRIFRPFERLHGTETYPGTGIGLAIVKKGIERLGGSVGVESEPGKGSRFWIQLKKGAREQRE